MSVLSQGNLQATQIWYIWVLWYYRGQPALLANPVWDTDIDKSENTSQRRMALAEGLQSFFLCKENPRKQAIMFQNEQNVFLFSIFVPKDWFHGWSDTGWRSDDPSLVLDFDTCLLPWEKLQSVFVLAPLPHIWIMVFEQIICFYCMLFESIILLKMGENLLWPKGVVWGQVH